MFEKLDLFRLAGGMARHATARQATIAENVAQADTPGYRSKDIAKFEDTFAATPKTVSLTRTRPGHMSGTAAPAALRPTETRDRPAGPDGNTVSLETEVMKTAESRMQHQTALAIYRSGMKILRASIQQR